MYIYKIGWDEFHTIFQVAPLKLQALFCLLVEINPTQCGNTYEFNCK